MTEPDEVKEMLNRFESEMHSKDAKDSNTVIKKFEYWTNRKATLKQQLLIRKYCKQEGIELEDKPYAVGISKVKGVPRKVLLRHYTANKYVTRKGYVYRVVARIPRGQKGVGRYAKKKI